MYQKQPKPTPTVLIREHYTGDLFKETEPVGLSSKPGVVLATQEHYAPNYLSIPGDRWVSSEGATLTCEELFDALTNKSEPCKVIHLSDYDFQDMYDVDRDQEFDDLTAAYANLAMVIEKTKVDVYDPTDHEYKQMRYGDLLVPGSVVKFKDSTYFFSIEFGTALVEGAWTDNESRYCSTQEFLLYVLNEGGSIELTYTV